MIIGESGLRVIGNLEVYGNIRVKGMIESEGEVKAPTFNGTATSAVVAFNIPTEDLGGNIWLASGDNIS